MLKKLSKLFLSLLLILLLNTTFSLQTSAAAVLLTENFNDGNANDGIPVDWDEDPGTGSWSVVDGKYKGTVNPGGVPPITLTGDPSWKNYSMEVTLTGAEGVDRHILFRFTKFHVRGYSIKYREEYAGVPGLIELQKHGPNVVLARNDDFKPSPGETHTIKIEVKDNRIKVFADGSSTPLIDYVDNVDPILDGRVGFMIEPSGIGLPTTTLYDNLIIESLGEVSEGLNVPDVKQYSSPWGEQEYDTASNWADNPTISKWGCALTSATMALQYNGHDVNPGSLNTWLNNNNGYLRNGSILWPAISRYSRFSKNTTSPDGSLLEFKRYGKDEISLNELLDARKPGLVKLPNPQHFVVVKGANTGDYLINDPGQENKALLSEAEGLHGAYTQVNVLSPSQTDLSYLVFVVNPGNTLNITDLNGNVYPFENYLEEPLTDNETGTPLNDEALNVYMLPKPESGNYLIEVSGPDGPFTLDSYLYDAEGNLEPQSFDGTIEGQRTVFFSTNFDKDDIANSDTVDVSFDSLLDDLGDAYAEEKIDKKTYLALKKDVTLAKSHYARRPNISELLLKLAKKAIFVLDQKNKIDGQTASMLVEKIDLILLTHF